MTAEIITFHTRRAAIGAPKEQASLREGARPLSATHKNALLRRQRRDNWRRAEVATRYWNKRMEFEYVAISAQRCGLPEGDYQPFIDAENDRYPVVLKYREALVRQLLTHAPDVTSVTWKQRVDYQFLEVKRERVERVIADDLAFLAAHPTRRARS